MLTLKQRRKKLEQAADTRRFRQQAQAAKDRIFGDMERDLKALKDRQIGDNYFGAADEPYMDEWPDPADHFDLWPLAGRRDRSKT